LETLRHVSTKRRVLVKEALHVKSRKPHKLSGLASVTRRKGTPGKKQV